MIDEKEYTELKNKVADLDRKMKPVNDIARDINAMDTVTLNDVSGTPNSGDLTTDTIITNLMTENNKLNGQVDVLISTVNKLLSNIKGQ